MENTKLVELVKSIKPEEKLHLLEFSNLQYFNNGRMRAYVPALLEICLKHPWQESSQRLKKNYVYSKIFPDQEFVEGKLEKVMVEAQKIIGAFLSSMQYFRPENEFHQELDLAESLRLRGLSNRYELSMAHLKKMQQEDACKDHFHYLRQIHLDYALHYKASIDNQSRGELHIPELLSSIDIYHCIRRVALLSRYLLQQRVTRLETPAFIQKEIDELQVPEPYLKSSPGLMINFEIFKVMKRQVPELEEIRVLLDKLLLVENKLNHELQQEYYSFLQNFAVFVINSNNENEQAVTVHHSLNKLVLQKGFLLYEGKISPHKYNIYTTIALRVQDFEWALNFIETHRGNIHGENETQDFYRFNKARYLFAIGKFEECLDILPPTSRYLNYFLIGKRMELKALFEMESDLLSFRLDNFKMYLSRTSIKIMDETSRQNHLYFVNYLHQLVHSIPGDKKRSEELLKRIRTTKNASEYRWLLAKAEELGTKK